MFQRSILAIGLATFAVATPAVAQETRADVAHKTHPIIERITELGTKPFQCNLNLNVTGDNGETAKGTAKVAFQSVDTFALDMNLTVDEGNGAENGTFKIIADGSFVTIEVAAAGQGTQAFKLSIDFIREMIAENGGFEMPGMGDPLGRLQEALNMDNFQETATNGGKTTRFTATIDPVKLPAEFQGGIAEAINLVFDFDTNSGFPLLIQAKGASGPAFTLSTSNLKFPKMIAPSTFKYTAPEGAFVMDITSMLQAQMDMQNQGEF